MSCPETLVIQFDVTRHVCGSLTNGTLPSVRFQPHIEPPRQRGVQVHTRHTLRVACSSRKANSVTCTIGQVGQASVSACRHPSSASAMSPNTDHGRPGRTAPRLEILRFRSEHAGGHLTNWKLCNETNWTEPTGPKQCNEARAGPKPTGNNAMTADFSARPNCGAEPRPQMRDK